MFRPKRQRPIRGDVSARADDDPLDIAPALHILLEALADVLHHGHIDAIPTPSWPAWERMPAGVRAAQETLHQRGLERGTGDPTMGIDLDLTAPEDVELLRLFGPWTINSEAYDSAEELQVMTHDEGYSCFATVSLREAAHLGAVLRERGTSFDAMFVERHGDA